MDELISNPKFVQDYLASRKELFKSFEEEASGQNNAIEEAIKNIQKQQKMLFKTQEKIRESNKVISHIREGFKIWQKMIMTNPERVAREMKRLSDMLEEKLDG